MNSLRFARILLIAALAAALSPQVAAAQQQQQQQQNVTTTPAPEPATAQTTTANPPTETELPAITSTLDSIGVGDPADPTTVEPEPATESEVAGAGIEPKSISRESDNALADHAPAGHSAELAIESEAPAAESAENTDDSAGRRAQPKLGAPANLNMSQVDASYVAGTRAESETVESWRQMSKKMRKGIGSVIGTLVPYALNMSAEAKISSNCSGAMLKWVLSMNQLKSWALRMLDAAGKPVAGLLEGSMTMFGNYRQCLKVRAPDDDEIEFTGEFREYFRGKYCIIQAKPWLPEKSKFYNLNTKIQALMQPPEDEEPPKWYDKTIFDELSEWILAFNFVDIRYDLCVPSQCSREDIQKAVNYLVQGLDLKARVLRCEMEASDARSWGAAQVESGSAEIQDALVAASSADSASPSFYASLGQLGWLLLPFVALVVVLLATAVSMAMGGDAGLDDDDDDKAKLRRTIKSLSLERSISSHLNVDYDQLADDKPLALYGVRFLLVVWVLLVESAVNLKFEYLRELMMLKDLIFWWPMQFIINSTLQFDSIILLTAFTMGYKNSLNNGLNQAKALTRFVVDKYIRLMPSVMVMVALTILLPLVFRGPVWNDYVSKQSAVCQSMGWLNTVFLQNYLPYKEICLPQTWLFCVEFQLVLLMAPILYYLNEDYTKNYHANGRGDRSPKDSIAAKASRPFYWMRTVPGLILLGCVAVGVAGSFYDVYHNELPPSYFYTMADPDSKSIYFGQHLTKLWTHLAVFAAGLLAGVECRRASKNAMRGYRSNNLGLLGIRGSGPLTGHNKNYSLSSNSLTGNNHNQSDLSINITSNSSSENIDLESGTTGSNLNPSGTLGGSGGEESSGGFCSMLINFISCLTAVATMGAIIFSTHDWSLNDLPPPLVAGLFDAGSRLAWSVAFIWILYMVCVPDKQRNFNCLARMLGHPLMVSLGKLSFLVYLIHPFVHLTVLAIQEQPIYSSWLMLFHILIGNITITVILSSMMSLFVEMPCRNLFRRCGTSILLSHHLESPSILTPTSTSSAASTTA